MPGAQPRSDNLQQDDKLGASPGQPEFKAMKHVQHRQALLARPEAIEAFVFGSGLAVFRISDKMCASPGEKEGVAFAKLKCDPDQAQALTDIFPAIRPGYHMNRKHWITITLDGSRPAGELLRLITMSYSPVLRGLPRPVRQSLEITHGAESLYA